MSAVHRIRLRGPWEVVALESTTGPLPPPTRMAVPCSWQQGGWPGFAGRAVHRRAFGKPTNLGPGEQVWLVIGGVSGRGEARLNQRVVAAIDQGRPFEFDVTEALAERNILEVEIAAGGDDGGVTGEVAIEIRRTS